MPSDSCRNPALPKPRIARILPAVRIVMRGLSSASAVLVPCSATMAPIEMPPSNRLGYGIDAELLELLKIGAALNDLIGLVCAHSRDSVRRIASRMPLMKRTESSALNDRASSRASLMITLPGVSGSCRNS